MKDVMIRVPVSEMPALEAMGKAEHRKPGPMALVLVLRALDEFKKSGRLEKSA